MQSQEEPVPGSKALKDPKRERFCQASLELNSLQKAYEDAGFKRARGNCNRLAREPAVATRLAYLWDRAAKMAETMGGRWLAKAEIIADANMFDFWDIDPETGSLKRMNLAKVPYASGAAVQEISYDANGNPKLKLHDVPGMIKFLIERAIPKPQKVALTNPEGDGPVEHVFRWKTPADASSSM